MADTPPRAGGRRAVGAPRLRSSRPLERGDARYDQYILSLQSAARVALPRVSATSGHGTAASALCSHDGANSKDDCKTRGAPCTLAANGHTSAVATGPWPCGQAQAHCAGGACRFAFWQRYDRIGSNQPRPGTCRIELTRAFVGWRLQKGAAHDVLRQTVQFAFFWSAQRSTSNAASPRFTVAPGLASVASCWLRPRVRPARPHCYERCWPRAP